MFAPAQLIRCTSYAKCIVRWRGGSSATVFVRAGGKRISVTVFFY